MDSTNWLSRGEGYRIMWEGKWEDIETVGEGESDLSTLSGIFKEVKKKK